MFDAFWYDAAPHEIIAQRVETAAVGVTSSTGVYVDCGSPSYKGMSAKQIRTAKIDTFSTQKNWQEGEKITRLRPAIDRGDRRRRRCVRPRVREIWAVERTSFWPNGGVKHDLGTYMSQTSKTQMLPLWFCRRKEKTLTDQPILLGGGEETNKRTKLLSRIKTRRKKSKRPRKKGKEERMIVLLLIFFGICKIFHFG